MRMLSRTFWLGGVVCASLLGIGSGTATAQAVKTPAAKSPAAPAGQNAKQPLSPREQAFLDRDITIHVLNRCTFGPKPGQVTKVFEKGWKKWIEEQLYPEKIDDSKLDQRLQEEFPSLFMTMSAMWEKYQPGYETMGMMMGEGRKDWTEEQRREFQRKRNELRNQIRQETLDSIVLRAAYSERELYEVVCEFWRNHFAIDINKEEIVYLAPNWEQTVLRAHAFGRFEDLLLASATHPAMLIYLDNVISQRPLTEQEQKRLERFNPETQRKSRSILALERHRGLNENYARELLELHTLGADNGYSQYDVTELARALTGWSVARKKDGEYGFFFNQEYNDRLPKFILGRRLSGQGGLEEGAAVIRGLANHPQTAKFISWKLCRYFVNDEPPIELVDRVARKWRSTGGNLREVYREILTSPEFTDPKLFKSKFKTPFEYVISAVRATNAEIVSTRPMLSALERMGMPLYQCDDPTGYYDQAEAWCDPGVLIHRWDFAMKLASAQFRGITVPESFYEQYAKATDGEELKTRLINNVVPGGIDEKTSKVMDEEADVNLGGVQGAKWMLGILLGSPAFMAQ